MNLLDPLSHDFRMAMRMLLKNRGSSALAILSIALGIGITTALFTVADALLFRPSAIVRSEEVYRVSSRGDDQRTIGYGWRDYEDMARASAGLGELIGYQRVGSMLAGEDTSEAVITYIVTPNFFSMLGATAEQGHVTVAATGDGRPQVVLGHRLWLRRFGGDPGVVGKTIVLNRTAYVVAGVMPASFSGLVRGVPCDVFMNNDTWLTTLGARREASARNGQFDVAIRLRAGVTPEVAAARLDGAIRGEGAHKPAPAGAAATSLNPIALSWKGKLLAGGGLLPVFGLLLLVACANAAQLRLAQAEARKRELGVRLALGSSPWRLVRLLVFETLLLSVAGAGLGLLFAHYLIGTITAAVAGYLPLFDFGLRLDWRAGVFTVVATLAATLLAGVSPARHALRLSVLDILRAEDGTARAKNRMQRCLIAGQTAASVVFFGFALLFIASFHHAAEVWPGFDPTKSMVVLNAGPSLRMSTTAWAEQACEQLRGVPGVRATTFARRLPLSDSGGGARFRVEVAGQAPLAVGANMVGANYFSVMGTRLIVGRGIGAEDRDGAPLVAVVSQQLARQLFGERNPVGEWATIEGQLRQIVGVAENAPSNSVHEEPLPFLFLPHAQFPRGDLTLLVETAVDPASLVRPIQQELKRFDPGFTTYGVTTLRQHLDRALFIDRMTAIGTTGVGILGFLLTAAGLFGIVQYSVNRRTRELGVRMALGAEPDMIRNSVLRESLALIAPGIALGLVLLAAGAWYERSALFGVGPLDPFAYIACAAAAAAVALLAAWLPARRATKVNPIVALRAE